MKIKLNSCCKAVLIVGQLLLSSVALAEVKQAAPEGFVLTYSKHIHASPAKVFSAIGNVDQWWSSEHSWSGNAANFSMGTEAGNCFCERWKDGSVVHGQVIMSIRDQVLRLDTPLGPLQGLAVKAILTFSLKPDGTDCNLTVAYVVNGVALSKLDQSAPAVDAVLGEQLMRLQSYIETGVAEKH